MVAATASGEPTPAVHVVLASGSPRRYELLAGLGLEFDVVVPDVDESIVFGEDPATYVQRVAHAKAGAVVGQLAPGRVVVAADTTVAVDDRILAKPDDAAHARAMLRTLSGRTHLVHTGLVVARSGEPQGQLPGDSHDDAQGGGQRGWQGGWHGDLQGDGQGAVLTRVVTTEVCFDVLDPGTIDRYVATGEPLDKAGAYALQGRGGALVRAVHGSVSNVIGLPLVELRELLRIAGVNPE